MKLLLMAIFSLFTAQAFALSEIVLDPGSHITVKAGDELSILCSGSSNLDPSKPDCIIVEKNKTDKYGNECKLDSFSHYCVRVYKFGIVAFSWRVDNSEEAIKLCENHSK